MKLAATRSSYSFHFNVRAGGASAETAASRRFAATTGRVETIARQPRRRLERMTGLGRLAHGVVLGLGHHRWRCQRPPGLLSGNWLATVHRGYRTSATT